MFDLENLPFDTGQTRGLEFDEVIDRYWEHVSLENQKKIIKEAHNQVVRLQEKVEQRAANGASQTCVAHKSCHKCYVVGAWRCGDKPCRLARSGE